MNVYVAGRTSDKGSVRAAQALCVEAGCEITFDWTGEEGEIRHDWSGDASERATKLAKRERQAVLDADLLVLIWHVEPDRPGPLGALLECGMAMCERKPIIVIGEARESVFWYLPEVTRVARLTDLPGWLAATMATD